jgi:hypothetical protein
MELLEIYADEGGETHFRRTDMPMELRNFAPPSQPINVSAEVPSTTSVFLVAPPGWDEEFHPTPRRQFAIMLRGKATISATDGETINVEPGNIILLNDQDSKGHLTRVQGKEDAAFLLVGTQQNGA